LPPKNRPAAKAGPEPADAPQAPPVAETAEQLPANGETSAQGAASQEATPEGTSSAGTTAPEATAKDTASGEATSEGTAPSEGTARSEDSISEDAAAEDAAAETGPADEAGATPEAAPGGAPARRPGLRVPALLAAVVVVLGGFGVWATLQANSLRASNAGQNVALTDAAATAAVRHQVSSAVNQIFSYRYTDTAATRRAAQTVLTGRAIRQYDQLFSLVEKQAPAQKLVVTTTVTNSGVQFLSGDRARVLIYANQQDTRAGTSQSTYAGAMFAVTAVRSGDRWKIENIDTFTGS
jgi:Mce-associated membrane protein